jgi:hypothetical protein
MTSPEEIPQPRKYIPPGDDITHYKKPNYKVVNLTLREYASGSTIHGISYIFDKDTHALDRIFWIIVVVAALFGAIWFSVYAYVEWQDDPVITTIGTTGLPIEKVKFPSITICAQGTAKEIVDAALFKQFTEYLDMKNKIFSDLTPQQLNEEGHAFLRDMYPGAKMAPNKLVAMMASPGGDSDKAMQAAAIFNPEPDDDCEVEDDSHNRTKRSDEVPSCPDGWWDNALQSCIYYHNETLNFNDAESFCTGQGARLLEIKSNEEYQTLYTELQKSGHTIISGMNKRYLL